MKKFLIVFNLGNLGDIITTLWGLHKGLVEANPMMAYILANYGAWGFIAIKLFVGAATTVVLAKREAHKTLRFVSILIWVVVLFNLLNLWRMS